MNFDATTLNPPERYHLLSGGVTPRPIAWISTISADGINNIAPYSFFNVVSCTPPVLMYSQVTPRVGQDKDTLNNLLQTKECVIHIVQSTLAEKMNLSCAELSAEKSEFNFAEIETRKSHSVKPLSVNDALLCYECTLREVIRIGNMPGGGSIVLLDVKNIYVDETLLKDMKINQKTLDSIGKMGGDFFTFTQELFEMQRP